MSVKIKVSYEQPEELQRVLKCLRPVIKSYKVAKEQKGKYRRVYIELNK